MVIPEAPVKAVKTAAVPRLTTATPPWEPAEKRPGEVEETPGGLALGQEVAGKGEERDGEEGRETRHPVELHHDGRRVNGQPMETEESGAADDGEKGGPGEGQDHQDEDPHHSPRGRRSARTPFSVLRENRKVMSRRPMGRMT